VAAERRVKPGDLVTDRFSHGTVLMQYKHGLRPRDTRLSAEDVALVTWVGISKEFLGVNRDVCDVLFKGEVWQANTITATGGER
jgi:hypothetical protein